jgi:CTP synthase
VPIHSESLTPENVSEKLENLDGLLVAPGFGQRGIEGKVSAIRFARETGLPFFGICLGMQMAVIEFGRNVLNIKNAQSSEMYANPEEPVIDMMEEQKKITTKGGTMRLGSYPCEVKPGTLAYKIYGTEKINERHRHRFEFNNKYLDQYEAAGMKASGRNPETGLVEIVEIQDHPFFIGCQYHPELKSTVERPHPLFVHFVGAAKEFNEKKETNKNPLLQSEMI